MNTPLSYRGCNSLEESLKQSILEGVSGRFGFYSSGLMFQFSHFLSHSSVLLILLQMWFAAFVSLSSSLSQILLLLFLFLHSRPLSGEGKLRFWQHPSPPHKKCASFAFSCDYSPTKFSTMPFWGLQWLPRHLWIPTLYGSLLLARDLAYLHSFSHLGASAPQMQNLFFPLRACCLYICFSAPFCWISWCVSTIKQPQNGASLTS